VDLRLLIIHENPRPDSSCNDLIKTALELGHEVKYVRTRRLIARLSRTGMEVIDYSTHDRVDCYDGGVVRSFGHMISLSQFMRRVAILRLLELRGVVLMNPVSSLVEARNKLLTLIKLKSAGIPVPETLSTESLRVAYDEAKRMCPLVMKPIIGSRGYGVVLAQDADTVFNIMKSSLTYGQPLLLQEYVESRGCDIRAFVVGSQVIAAMRRRATQSWKTNIAQGGKGEAIRLSEELEELAIRAAQVMNLWYAGVDIVEGKEGTYVLEVNASPEWRELKHVAGVNPAKYIIEFLVEKVKSGELP